MDVEPKGAAVDKVIDGDDRGYDGDYFHNEHDGIMPEGPGIKSKKRTLNGGSYQFGVQNVGL